MSAVALLALTVAVVGLIVASVIQTIILVSVRSNIVTIMFDVKEVLTNQQVARQKEEAREKGAKR